MNRLLLTSSTLLLHPDCTVEISGCNLMGTVTKRQLLDGTIRYRAQVRIKKEGYPDFKASKTFSKKSLADEWIKRTEAEIELNPDKILNPVAEVK